MERTAKPVVYVDTHIVCWLYQGLTEKLSQPAISAIDAGALYISPIVDLELQYLYEIGRIAAGPEVILPALSRDVGLQISLTPFTQIVVEARTIQWTRDPFDRLIVAEVMLVPDALLVTRDRSIRTHCDRAVW